MISEKEKIHLADILFSEFCQLRYNINRGIYNTIDTWFYENGEKNILARRKLILEFLRFVNGSGMQKVKFGKGGLSRKLQEFYLLHHVS